MNPNHRETWPVVIVGAGPAGLATAITLASYGIECCVVDRHAGPSPHPRATALSLRTMELMRRWGLHDRVMEGDCDAELQMRIAPTLAEVASGTTVDVGFPTRAQSAAISPTAPACVPQDHIESVLVEHLASLPAARLLRRTKVVGLRRRLGERVLTLRDESSGAIRDVEACYVVGADGIRSTIRNMLGIKLGETPSLYEGTSVVFHAPLWDIVGEHRYGIYAIEHPDGAGILLPAGPGDRWVYAHDRLDDEKDHSPVARISAAVGRPLPELRVGDAQPVSFVGALAAQFRKDDVFLVGDAAHRVTPRGGTGLNTALADGFDLGWKLAWVLRGWARPSLLDTYETERRPVAEHQFARSIDPDGSRRGTERAVTVDVGGRIRHAWLPGSARRSTLDLVGPGVTVLRHGPRRGRAVGRWSFATPVDEHELDPVTALALGILPGADLAVRPDGVPLVTSPAIEIRTLTPTENGANAANDGALPCPVLT